MNTKICVIFLTICFSYTTFAGILVCEFKHRDKDGTTYSKTLFDTEKCRKGHSKVHRFSMKDFKVAVSCTDHLDVQAGNSKAGFEKTFDLNGKKAKKTDLVYASTPKKGDSYLRVKCFRANDFFDSPKLLW